MINVLQAAQEGKQIQCKRGDSKWINSYNPAWNFYELEYRAKPEPREFWIRNRQMAVDQGAWGRDEIYEEKPINSNFVHVREVIE